MGLIDTLRKAEEQGRGAARRGFERAREAMDDAERRLRRKMRLHPRTPPAESTPVTIPIAPVSSDAAIADKTLAHRASEEDAA